MTPRFLLAVLILTGCAPATTGSPPPPDEEEPAPRTVLVIASHPHPDDPPDSFLFEDSAWVRFAEAPDDATLSIDGVEGQSSVDGLVHTFTPDEPLDGSTAYTMRLDWSPSDASPLVVEFTTAPHGRTLDQPTELIDATFHLDLASADFTEPPGLGPLIGPRLGEAAVLFAATADSDLDGGVLHMRGALGTDGLEQDPCSATLEWTAGPDGVIGTGDDTPADWENPRFAMGPSDLVLQVEGADVRLYDVFLVGIIHPELEDMRGVAFDAILDTRALDPLLSNGAPGDVCELIEETIGVECTECGPPEDGLFCLPVAAENIVATRLSTVVLEPASCVDVIERVLSGTCEEVDDDGYDADEDGIYEGCLDYVP